VSKKESNFMHYYVQNSFHGLYFPMPLARKSQGFTWKARHQSKALFGWWQFHCLIALTMWNSSCGILTLDM